MNSAQLQESSLPLSPTGVPAYLVGVTGYMELAEEEIPVLQKRVRRVFRFLRHGAGHPDPEEPGRTVLESLLDDLAPAPNDGSVNEMRKVYERALADWHGLGKTPIV